MKKNSDKCFISRNIISDWFENVMIILHISSDKNIYSNSK